MLTLERPAYNIKNLKEDMEELEQLFDDLYEEYVEGKCLERYDLLNRFNRMFKLLYLMRKSIAEGQFIARDRGKALGAE